METWSSQQLVSSDLRGDYTFSVDHFAGGSDHGSCKSSALVLPSLHEAIGALVHKVVPGSLLDDKDRRSGERGISVQMVHDLTEMACELST
jgi:hypothetical protein